MEPTFPLGDWLGSPPGGEDAHRDLRARVRSFLHEEVVAGRFTPRCDSWLTGWDPEFSRRLAARGWVGMTVPARYGGQGRGALDRYVVTLELLAAGAPVAAHWIADRQIAPALVRYGSPTLRRRFLPGIARGEHYFALGMSEPDSGSDLASVRTRAVRARGGGWRVTGSKVWTSGAHRAHHIVVLCRTGDAAPTGQAGTGTAGTAGPEPVAGGAGGGVPAGGGAPAAGPARAAAKAVRHAGLSQLVVPLDAPGVQVRPIRLLTGEEHFNEVIFDEVPVADDMVIGTVGAGWRQVTSELAVERSGPERFLSTYPLLHALVDRLRGTGTGSAAAVVGALYADLLILRQMSWSVARRLDEGVSPEVGAALVKDLGTAFERTVYEAARGLLHAEPDVTAQDPYRRLLAQAVLHSPGFTLRGGTSEILRQVVARAVLEAAS